MTRRDYEKIADAIGTAHRNVEAIWRATAPSDRASKSAAHAAIMLTTRAIERVMEDDNPRFSLELFEARIKLRTHKLYARTTD